MVTKLLCCRGFFRAHKMEASAILEEEAQAPTYCCYFGQILRAASYFKG